MTDAFEQGRLHPESWVQHAQGLTRTAYALLGDVHASEDVVQTAALRALTRSPRVLSRAWLERVVKNLARDLLRRRGQGEVELPDVDGLQTPLAPSADEVAERLALGRLVLEAVNSLDEPHRRTVYLRYFEGLSVKEVARALHVPRRTAQTRLYRALAKLRERLGDGGSSERGWHAVACGLIGRELIAEPARPIALASRAIPSSSSVLIHAGGLALMLKKIALVTFALVAAIGVWSWVDGPMTTAPATQGRVSEEPVQIVAPDATTAASERREAPSSAPVPLEAKSTRARTAGAGSLRVQVLWPEGEPAEGVAVLLRSVRADLPDRSLAREFTDESGAALFDDLVAGPVAVSCVRAGSRPTHVDIVAGEEHSVTLSVRPGARVRGVVRDVSGQPVPDAEIWLTTGSTDWQGGHVVTRGDRTGRFELRDLPSRQSLAAIAEGYAPSGLLDLELLDLDSQPVEVTLTLRESGGAIRGIALAPDGSPVAGAWVAVGSSPQLHGLGRAGNSVEYWTPRAVRTDEAGSFRVGGLAAGIHQVSARGASFPVWKSSSVIRVSETTHVEVRFVDAVSVSGTVRDATGRSVAHATVRALNLPVGEIASSDPRLSHADAFESPSVRSDPSGRYELTALPPGTLDLYACEGAARSKHTQAFARERLDVRAGEHVTWDAVLMEGQVVHGRLTYRSGDPIVMAVVTLHADPAEPEEDQLPETMQPTDTDGRFRFIGLDQRSFTLRAALDSHSRGGEPLEARGVWPGGPGVTLVADFDPQASQARGAVVGRIYDAGGRLEGCKLELLLESEQHSWRTGAERQGDRFQFDAVEAGKYKIVVLCGENPVVHSEWFEVLPGETTDIGALVTQTAGGLELQLLRGPGTEACVPMAVVRPADSWQGRRQELAGGDVHTVAGLTPGAYVVHLYGMGMANVQREVQVVAGESLRLDLTLEAAMMCPLEVDWPEDAIFEHLELRVTDRAGQTRWSQPLINGNSLKRPYRRGLHLPVGSYILRGESDGGHEGAVEFEVQDLERTPANARLELR